MQAKRAGKKRDIEVGTRVRDAREKQGLTRKDLAERAHLKIPAITQVETGRRKPSFDTLVALAKGLGVSLDYLAGLKGSPDASDAVMDPNLKKTTELYLQLPREKQMMVREFVDFVYGKKK